MEKKLHKQVLSRNFQSIYHIEHLTNARHIQTGSGPSGSQKWCKNDAAKGKWTLEQAVQIQHY